MGFSLGCPAVVVFSSGGLVLASHLLRGRVLGITHWTPPPGGFRQNKDGLKQKVQKGLKMVFMRGLGGWRVLPPNFGQNIPTFVCQFARDGNGKKLEKIIGLLLHL